MFLMISADHTLEQRTRFITQGAGIQMDDQEHGQYKTHHNMQYIIEYESADIKYGSGNPFREHQCDSGDNNERHSQVHDKYIGHFLQGIEFLLLGDGEGMGLSLEYAHRIKHELLP